MKWRPFALWNAAGGIAWATTIGLVAYFLGQSTSGAFFFGIAGLVTVLSVGGILRARSRRAEGTTAA